MALSAIIGNSMNLCDMILVIGLSSRNSFGVSFKLISFGRERTTAVASLMSD
jgi:hypothetical protein